MQLCLTFVQSLTVHLDCPQCFSAEVYAGDVFEDLPPGEEETQSMPPFSPSISFLSSLHLLFFYPFPKYFPPQFNMYYSKLGRKCVARTLQLLGRRAQGTRCQTAQTTTHSFPTPTPSTTHNTTTDTQQLIFLFCPDYLPATTKRSPKRQVCSCFVFYVCIYGLEVRNCF